MTKNVTTPRPKKTVVIEDTTAMELALIDAGIEAAGVVNPLGTHVPASTEAPVALVIPPSTPAGVNLPAAEGNSAPIAVPVPATPAQLAAREMRVNMGKNWIAFMGVVPGADGAAFIEPDKAALKAMRVEYAAANSLDLTDEDDLIAAAIAVKGQVDTARAAHESALANTSSVKLEYYRAARTEVLDMLATVDTLITTLGGKVNTPKKSIASTDGAVKSTERTKAKWSEWAPKLNAYATKLGLDGVYFVDRTVGGYKGVFHVLKLHADGRWEKCNYNADTHIPTPTGEFVTTWKYFGTDGIAFSEKAEQDKLAHQLNKDEMYGILLIKGGAIIDIPSLSYALVDEKNERKVGTVKHYSLPTVFFNAAGIAL